MPWQQLTLTCNGLQADEAELALNELSALAITLRDAQDQPLLEPQPGEMPLWSAIRITGLFDQAVNLVSIREQLVEKLNWLDAGSIQSETLGDQQWERTWLQYFKPIDCGNRLWICPSHCQPIEKDAVNIILDPGLAFGTGTHPTTKLCLQWLAQQNLQGKTIIDYGCGSGILAIAALKLGAKKAICIDNDPQALIATRDNAQRNSIPVHDIETILASKAYMGDQKADVVLANIIASILIQLVPAINTLVKPHGTLVLSGILETQIDDVQQAYLPYIKFDTAKFEQQWVMMAGSRK